MCRTPKSKRGKVLFSIGEKLKIVSTAYREKRNIKPTARLYGISPSTIRYWKKTLSTLSTLEQETLQNKKCTNQGKKPEDQALYKNILEYFENIRKQGRPCSMQMLVRQYRTVAGSSIKNVGDNALKQRIWRWMKRSKLSYRKVTHQAQLTRHCRQVMIDFSSYVNERIKISNINPSNVVNMDKTNIDFSIDTSTTIEHKGKKTVSVQKGGGEGNRCTVALSVSLGGEKLTPFIIYKGRPGKNSRIIKEFGSDQLDYPSTLHYTIQPKAWMDETCLLKWIDDIWRPWCKGRGTTYLLIDSASVHKTKKIQQVFAECNTMVDYIPKGYTSKLQTLDVGVNKPFKDNIRKEYELMMIEKLKEQTNLTLNNTYRAKRWDVAKWIDIAWNNIREETITNTWKKIGINGTNDAAAFSDEDWNSIFNSLL